MFHLTQIQQALRDCNLPGWLLYDFRGSNVPTRRVLGLSDPPGSRRFFYFVPAQGTPHKLVHRIEENALDSLPGDQTVYLSWQELTAGVKSMLAGTPRVAMEYSPRNSNPYVSRVDAGTVEMVRACGVEVVSSGDLVQLFEAVWDDAQIATHRAAAVVTDAAYGVAWRFIAEEVRQHGRVSEVAVQTRIMQHFHEHQLTTYHPPIVARPPQSALPHYETGVGEDIEIRPGDLVLIDLWAKQDRPRAVYSDLTRMAYLPATNEETPTKYAAAFAVVTAARDAAIACVTEAFRLQRPIQGFEVDDACRAVIQKSPFAGAFVHRTGHNIGQEVHGNGANIDNLESHEERRLLPRTCFSIEPGIYLPGQFGVRSEINVLITPSGEAEVTGGALQTRIHRIG